MHGGLDVEAVYRTELGGSLSDVQDIISQLEQQRDAIERAIAALRDITPAQSAVVQRVDKAPSAAERGTRGHITPAGRRKLAEAMKRRWAAKRTAQRASARKASKEASGRGGSRKKTVGSRGSVKKRAPRKAVAAAGGETA